MRILELHSSNIKRLSAITITPDPKLPVIMIGGENGAGKSSALDSIMYALGGQDLIPAEPIKAGETEAEIKLDLGDLRVTRKFRRQTGECNCTSPAELEFNAGRVSHSPDCAYHRFSPTTSTLMVTNAEGAKYPSPQALLDKLLGKLSFDPEEFNRLDGKAQAALLRRMCGLDTAPLDERRQVQVQLRQELKRQLARDNAVLNSAKHYPDAPEQEVSVAELTALLSKAEEARQTYATEAKELQRLEVQLSTTAHQRVTLSSRIEEYERLLAAARLELHALDEQRAALSTTVLDKRETLEGLRKAVPDVHEIQLRFVEAEDTNQKVRANKAHKALAEAYSKTHQALADVENEVKTLDQLKSELLANAKFPIDGLGLSETGVTWKGLPLEQASTSERLRVGVAIGLALNPKLRVILIRNGNALDKKALLALAEQAAEGDAQVWVEYVTDDPSKVSVLIEDGHLV